MARAPSLPNAFQFLGRVEELYGSGDNVVLAALQCLEIELHRDIWHDSDPFKVGPRVANQHE